jgi:peptide/nickel transport system substrate-binding protein
VHRSLLERRRNMKKRALWLAVLLALLLIAAACGGGTSTSGGGSQTGGKVVKGGIFRIGSLNTIDSLNPFVAFNENAYVAFVETMPVLVEYDSKLSKIVGDWASSWETSPDGKIWTFHLKPGKWSDGTPLTAEDAVWTCDTDIKYADGPAASHAVFLSHASKCEAPDPQTLVITYEKAVANVLPQLQQWFVLPKHVWQNYTGHNGKDLKTYKPESQLPIVSAGPFKITKYDKKGTTIFEKNPSYYGEPNVDAVGLQIFQNQDAMVSALRSGELDFVDGLPSNVVKDFESNPKFEVHRNPGFQVNDFIFNSNPKKPKHRELLDPKVREAFAHAIDKQQIADVVFAGNAKPVVSIVAPITGKWMNTDLDPEKYDPDLANQLLDEAGYPKGSDGIRTAGDHKMQYEMITPTSLEGINREFEIVQKNLADVGVKVSQKALDDTTAFEEIGAPDWKYEKFDLALWDWVGYLDPDFVLSVIACNQYGNWSDTGYCNPEYDQLYKEQGVAIDPEKRKQIVWQMQEIMQRDRPYIQLVNLELITANSKNWGDVLPQTAAFSKIYFTSPHKVG